jgi:hypothetical protein
MMVGNNDNQREAIANQIVARVARALGRLTSTDGAILHDLITQELKGAATIAGTLSTIQRAIIDDALEKVTSSYGVVVIDGIRAALAAGPSPRRPGQGGDGYWIDITGATRIDVQRDGSWEITGEGGSKIAHSIPVVKPPQPEPKVRVLRLIEYVGDREAVEKQLQGGTFPGGSGSKRLTINGGAWRGNGHDLSKEQTLVINSTLISQWPEIVNDARIEEVRDWQRERDSYEAQLTAAQARIAELELTQHTVTPLVMDTTTPPDAPAAPAAPEIIPAFDPRDVEDDIKF